MGYKKQESAVRAAADMSKRASAANPDVEIGIIQAKKANKTLDVALSHGDSSGNFPEAVKKEVPCQTYQLWQSAQVGQSVYVGYIHGNRNLPVVLGFSTQIAGEQPESPAEIPPYPTALPLTGLQWPTYGHDEGNTRSTGNTTGYWTPIGLSGQAANWAVANTGFISRIQAAKNRGFIITDGQDSGSDVTGKITSCPIDWGATIGSSGINYGGSPQSDPYYLRIVHQNIAEGSTTGASNLPGNGNPEDFSHNLHLYDIPLSDAIGITRTGDNTRVAPVSLSLQDYYFTQDFDPFSIFNPDAESSPGVPMTKQIPYAYRDIDRFNLDASTENLAADERLLATVAWACPPPYILSGTMYSASRVDGFIGWNTSGKFYITLHQINCRRSYQIPDVTDASFPVIGFAGGGEVHLGKPVQDILRNPTVKEDGTFGAFLSINGVALEPWPLSSLTITDLPVQRTLWVCELPYAPVGDAFLVKSRYYIPMAEYDGDGKLILHLGVVNANNGNYISTTDLSIPTPSPAWADDFYSDRPPEEVGVVPFWNEGLPSQLGNDYGIARGLVKNAGYLVDWLIHRVSADHVYLIPQWSYSNMIKCWEINGTSITESWTLLGYDAYPSLYTVYSTILVKNSKLLIHWEDFTYQSGSDLFYLPPTPPGNQLTGMLNWENAIIAFIGDETFTPGQWPSGELGHTMAFQPDIIYDNALTSSSEIDQEFDWCNNYWPGRSDEYGYATLSSAKIPSVRRHGWSLLDPTDGSLLIEGPVAPVNGTLGLRSGPLISEWFRSTVVPKQIDPNTVDDVYDKVVYRDGLNRAAFGCMAPLGANESEILIKVWDARIPYWDTYPDHLDFQYYRSSPSQANDSRKEFSRDCFGGNFDLTDVGNFATVDWGRQFWVWRLKTATTSFAYDASPVMPWNTLLAAAESYYVFLSNHLESFLISDVFSSIPVVYYGLTDLAYRPGESSEFVWTEADGGPVKISGSGDTSTYSLKYSDTSAPTLHGKAIDGKLAAWWTTAGGETSTRVYEETIGDQTLGSYAGADDPVAVAEGLSFSDDMVIYVPNDLRERIFTDGVVTGSFLLGASFGLVSVPNVMNSFEELKSHALIFYLREYTP